MTILRDANVLIALLAEGHVHHEVAEAWLMSSSETLATCPITEGSLVRFIVREGQPATTALHLLELFAGHPRYEFWPDNLSYRDVPLAALLGYRQVTDAYLVHLARAHNGRMVTFDRGLAAQHRDVVELEPTV